MDVAVARACPGPATFLAQIGVTSQVTSNLGSYMVEVITIVITLNPDRHYDEKI